MTDEPVDTDAPTTPATTHLHSSAHVRVELPAQGRDGVALVTIVRPEVLNALSFEVVGEIADAFEALDRHPDCRVIVLTGDGERAFAAGRRHQGARRPEPDRPGPRGPVHPLGPHPAHPQADRRRGPRLRPGRWLRAGDGLRHHRGRGRREVRPARDQARRDARRRRHPTTDPRDRQGPRDGPHPDRPDDRRPRGGGCRASCRGSCPPPKP